MWFFHATCVGKKRSETRRPCEPSARGAVRSGRFVRSPSHAEFPVPRCAKDFASGSRSRGRRQSGPARCEDVFVVCVSCFRSLPRSSRTHVNDPSAGSPTDTLLRLLRPLPQIICPTSQPNDHGQADHGTHPYRSLTGTIGRSDGRCVQRAGT